MSWMTCPSSHSDLSVLLNSSRRNENDTVLRYVVEQLACAPTALSSGMPIWLPGAGGVQLPNPNQVIHMLCNSAAQPRSLPDPRGDRISLMRFIYDDGPPSRVPSRGNTIE
jgi:hypothetical protein